MSSLGIALLILVFIGIGGVIAYNAWIVRREGRSVGSLLQDAPQPVDVNRTEPSLGEADTDLGQAERPVVGPATSFLGEQGLPDDPPPGMSSGPSVNSPASSPAKSSADSPNDLTNDSDGYSPPVNEPAAGVSAPLTQARPYFESALPGGTDEGRAQDADNSGGEQAEPTIADDDPPASPEALGEPDAVEPEGAPVGDAGADDEGTDDEGTKDVETDGAETAVAQTDKAETGDKASGPAQSPGAVASADPFSCVVALEPADPVSGSRLIELIGVFNRVGAKPVDVLAYPVDGAGQSETLQPSQQYRAVQFSLLLVNRHGAVNAMEYSEFVNRIQGVAEELDVLADIPDMSSVLEQSRELDEEIGALDAQVAINVVTEQTMNPGDLQLISGRLNLVEQGNNRYVRLNDQRKPVFSVSLGDKPNHVVLLLDVPRIPRDGQPLREMVECAWKCAQAFEGRMVDDAGQPIDNALFERIERQLDTHYLALDAAGVPAGSAQALRVFH
jgi:hypothetical protein